MKVFLLVLAVVVACAFIYAFMTAVASALNGEDPDEK